MQWPLRNNTLRREKTCGSDGGCHGMGALLALALTRRTQESLARPEPGL